jgi:mannose PTS system EIIA component
MNSILIIAHTPLASALRSAALHVFPDAASHIAAMDVPPLDSPEQTLTAAYQILAQTAPCSGITGTLVMSDVLGATPCNVAQQLISGSQMKCIAGASLPMLLRAITYWQEPLSVMAEKALAGATQGAIAVQASIATTHVD